MMQASKKTTQKRLKWYGHVRRMKEEHIVRRMLDVDIPGKRRRRPNIRWKDVCERDMTEAGLKEDHTTNRAAIPAEPNPHFLKAYIQLVVNVLRSESGMRWRRKLNTEERSQLLPKDSLQMFHVSTVAAVNTHETIIK